MQTGTPRFSVIIPVYNVEAYLEECLDSMLKQSFQDFEILVIDDVSKDNSLQIAQAYAQKYADKIRLIAHSVNKGLGGARNTGIEAAQGEYLLFLDSDDYLEPLTLEKVDACIRENHADIVEFCFLMVNEHGNPLGRTYCADNNGLPAVTRSVNACNKAFRRALFSDVRFPEKRYYEDYCTIPKLLMAAKTVSSLNEALYLYRQRTGSIVHDTNLEKNRDIMVGTDALLNYYKTKQFDGSVLTGLEYLAIYHVLYHATLRVNGIDRHSDLQATLRRYVEENFPNHRNNPYRKLLSHKEARLLRLIENERWDMLYACYHIRNRITGGIRRLLWKVKGI